MLSANKSDASRFAVAQCGVARPISLFDLSRNTRLMSRWLCWSLSLALALPGPIWADAVALPDLGDASASVISPAQERRLGENLMRQARHSVVFLDDPEVNAYLQTLGQQLVARADSSPYDFRFFAIADASVNAFAVPGGFIGVHTGLILAAQSEPELASVLAHEVAHITQRHIPRMIAEAKRTALPSIAALLAALVLAGSGQQGGNAAVALTSATVAQKGINFTRAAEEEADRIGIGLLTSAGFEPRAMPAFFERLQALNRHNETNLPEFLRTHPVTSARITESRDRAERSPYRQQPDSNEFRHVRAKIRALRPGDAAEIVRDFQYNLQQGKYANLDAERYGYAIALTRARRYDAARAEIRKLVERQPMNTMYRIAQAENEMAAGRYAMALSVYRTAYQRQPTFYPLQRYYAQALLKTGHANETVAIVRQALPSQADDPTLYALWAKAAGEAGRRAESHQAMAENYYWSGNLPAAIEQLQLARRLATDNFHLQSSLEARTIVIKEELATTQGK